VSSAIVLVAVPALAAAAVGGLLGWKLGHAAGLLHGAQDMLESDRQVIGKMAAFIAWQERKLDELGYDPATDPEVIDQAAADLSAEVEAYLRDGGGGRP
jgi:hypothetical protein